MYRDNTAEVYAPILMKPAWAIETCPEIARVRRLQVAVM
jgi:hypothetical protein